LLFYHRFNLQSRTIPNYFLPRTFFDQHLTELLLISRKPVNSNNDTSKLNHRLIVTKYRLITATMEGAIGKRGLPHGKKENDEDRYLNVTLKLLRDYSEKNIAKREEIALVYCNTYISGETRMSRN